MRFGAAFAIVYALGASLLLIGGAAGWLPYSIDGRPVTREQWITLAAPLFAISILLMACIAYAILRARRWSRPMVMAHWAAVFAYASVLLSRGSVERALALRAMAEAAVLGAVAAWYFYRKPNVVQYFKSLR